MKILEMLETRLFLSSTTVVAPLLEIGTDATSGTVVGYTPAEIRTAYGFNSVTLEGGASATGAGQTIAIVDAYNDPDIAGDLAAFDKEFGLSAANLEVVSQTGSTTALPSTNSGWDLEISLDVEWAHVIAPDANILLVEANSDSTTNLLDAVNYARNAAGVSVVSMSWGGSEFLGEASDDSYFTTPSGHEGVTFVAASGDEGSMFGPEWPASSADVLAVGGTTLDLANSSGAYGSESAWDDSTGGYSSYESELSYQSDVQTTGYRSSPDVSYDANPSTGVAVYDSVSYDGESGWFEVGGTSAGAPQWAGLIALADQDRAASGLGTLNGTTQTLPTLYDLYTNSTADADALHSISGSSKYSLTTGLGSPIANVVVDDLLDATTTTPTTVAVPAPTRTGRRFFFFGFGGRGGFFAQENQPILATAGALHLQYQFVPAGSARTDGLLMMTFSANRDPAAVETHPLAGAPAPTAFVSNSAAAAVAALTENSAVGAPSANAESTEAAAEVGRSIGVDGTLNTMPNQISAIVVAESALSGPILAAHTRDEELGSEWKQWAEIIGAAVIIGGVSVRALTRRRSGQNAQAGPLVSPFFG